EAEVRASTSALEGVRKENLAGARTLIDVLNAQQDLMAARARLIQAQRDRVVASHTLLAAIGRLDHKGSHFRPRTTSRRPTISRCVMPGMACVRRPDSEFHPASRAGVLALAAYGTSCRAIYVSD